MWLLLAFIAVPLIEIGLFIKVGGWLTLWSTLAIVLATGIIGTFLVRQQGLKVLAELRGSLSQMRDPLSPLAHGAMILFAGVLLLTPGFFTDTVGFLLLVPPLRQALIVAVAARVQVASFGTGSHSRTQYSSDTMAHADVIDADYSDLTKAANSSDAPKKDPNKRPSGWTEH